MAVPSCPDLAIVKATAPVMKEHGEAIARLFYGNMLAAHPELHNIFNKTGQDTGAQPRALASAVFAYATYIDDLAQLKDLVERIAQKHVSLVIQPEHYPIVGRYLIEAVAIVLGDAVTPEVAEAWTAAYSALADVFVNREKALYTAHENWSGWRKFRIQKKVIESVEITSFYLVPDDGQPLPLFEPGQYISLHMFIQELGYMQPRQYSLSEAPRSDYYRISVKRESGKKAGIAGLISNILHDNYKEGDIVELTYPAGEFFVNPETDRTTPVVLISAGVGVTPMISILNHSIATNTSRPISWVHGAHSTEVEAFSSHIRQICEKNLNVNATIFKSEVTVAEVKGVDYQFDGRVDLKKLDRERLFLDDVRAEYYICGPTDFMRNAQRFLINSGISKERVHLEIFGVGDGV
ncbi:globin-like protein [Xylariales sp. AK1849]|nr:globin-like protein [Xylariales sp. AK1849]